MATLNKHFQNIDKLFYKRLKSLDSYQKSLRLAESNHWLQP